MFEGMRATNVSLTRSSTSFGEEEPNACETACSMPQVVAITSAAGTPLPVASPTTSPSRPSEEVEVVEVSSYLASGLVEGRDLPALQFGHLLGQRGLLDAP